MPRPFCYRKVESSPEVTLFKPAGIPAAGLQKTVLHLDELEAIRLADGLGLDQNQTAQRMGVSRATVGRILARGRKKIADALTTGQAIAIEHGTAPVEITTQRCGKGRHRHGQR